MAVRITDQGKQILYENFQAGWGKHPEEQEMIVLGITDMDNEKTHLFPMRADRLEQFFELARQTRAEMKLETFGPADMPKGPHSA